MAVGQLARELVHRRFAILATPILEYTRSIISFKPKGRKAPWQRPTMTLVILWELLGPYGLGPLPSVNALLKAIADLLLGDASKEVKLTP